MSEQPAPMHRGVFGYRRSEVDRMLAERETMVRQAEARVRAAEEAVARLEREMEAVQAQSAMLRRQLQEQAATQSSERDLTARFVKEELGGILAAAEQSATRILERARQATEQQVEEAERVWRNAQSQITRFSAWRDRVDPALQGAHARIEEVRARIDQVPNLVRDALAPLADSIASLDTNLVTMSAATPPLLVAPSLAESAPGRSAESSATGDPAEGDEPAGSPAPTGGTPDPLSAYIPPMGSGDPGDQGPNHASGQ